jgi:hypothetical protein
LEIFVLPLNKRSDFTELKQELKVKPDEKPLNEVIDYLSYLGAKSAVIELDYIDKDFLAEYAFFYAKTFKFYSNKCKRIHFFSNTVSQDLIIKRELKSEKYLGFFVLRPTEHHRLGRTLIKPREDTFTLCQATFKVNLYGNDLTIKCMPFMQQDKQVSACAHVCLWMAFRYLHQAERYSWCSTVDIANIASTTAVIGNDIPAGKGGLNLWQLTYTIKQFNLQPLVYRPN